MSTQRKSLIGRIRHFKEKLYKDGEKRALEIEKIKKEVKN